MVGTLENDQVLDNDSKPKSKKSKHNPQLDTILMVEDFIEEYSREYKRRTLWQNLPKKMMYQTYKRIIEYLIDSHKIIIDNKGHVCWIPYRKIDREYIGDDDLTIIEK